MEMMTELRVMLAKWREFADANQHSENSQTAFGVALCADELEELLDKEPLMDPRMQMYLAEKQEACNVAWLKFVSEIPPSLRDVENEVLEAMHNLFNHVYSQAYSAGVDKGIEIGVCPKCGES